MRNYQRLFERIDRTIDASWPEFEAWEKSIEEGRKSCGRAQEPVWSSVEERKPSPRLAAISVQTLHYFMAIGFRSSKTKGLVKFSDHASDELGAIMAREQKAQRIRNLKVRQKIKRHQRKVDAA